MTLHGAKRLRIAVGLLCLVAGCSSARPPESVQKTDDEKREALEGMIQQVRDRYPAVQGVGAAQVSELVRMSEAVLVDVRPAAERDVSVIPGAITADAFLADPTRFGDRPVVAYCTVGERSARFAAEMAEQGVKVLNFEGSLLAWTHYGGPLTDAKGPTPALHVFGPTWDLAATGYETIW